MLERNLSAMMRCFLVLFVVGCAAFRNYTSSMPMSADGTTLFWTVSGGALQIGLRAPSLGWVAVGFATTPT
jgi:hypothetical protein